MSQVICIGSTAKDIFFPIKKGKIIRTPEDVTSKRKLAFEMGAKYQAEDSFEALGGGAANISVGLSKLGIKTGICSRIGDDSTGMAIKSELDSEGVDTSLLQVGEGEKSDISAIVVHEPSEDRIIFYNRDSNENLEINAEKLRKNEWIFLSSISGNHENRWEDNVEEIIDVVREKKVYLAFNPGQKNIKEDIEKVIKIIKHSQILILNKDEAIEIVMHFRSEAHKKMVNDESFLLGHLFGLGPEIVAITDGERGAWATDGKEFLHVDSYKNGVIDTTGAGDAFSSAFLAAHLSGEHMSECLRWGVVNGANVINFYGAHEGQMNKDEIMEKIKSVKTAPID